MRASELRSSARALGAKNQPTTCDSDKARARMGRSTKRGGAHLLREPDVQGGGTHFGDVDPQPSVDAGAALHRTKAHPRQTLIPKDAKRSALRTEARKKCRSTSACGVGEGLRQNRGCAGGAGT